MIMYLQPLVIFNLFDNNVGADTGKGKIRNIELTEILEFLSKTMETEI